MSDRPWKQLERRVARLIAGARYPANSGGDIDCESDEIAVQVKHRRTMSLAEIEREVLAIDQAGRQKGKQGGLVVKRKAGRGQPTPLMLVVVLDEPLPSMGP